MPVRPHHRHCIVAFLLHSHGVHLNINCFSLNQECPTQLVDTSGTPAQSPQHVRINLLLFLFFLDYYSASRSVIVHKCPLKRLLKINLNFSTQFLISLTECMTFRQHEGNRGSVVRKTTDLRQNWESHCIENPKLLHYHLGVASPKHKVFMSTFLAGMIGHIFDDTQYFDPQILKHFNSLNDIHEGESLRSGDDHSTVKFQLLAETDLDVSRPRRHIHHQVVQFPPMSLMKQLGQH